MVRHLAGVERWWFQVNFAGEDVPMLYYSDEDPDQDFEFSSADFTDDLAVGGASVIGPARSWRRIPWTTKGRGFATGKPSRYAACWSR